MPTTINLLRHAQAFHNLATVDSSQLKDAALTELGERQAYEIRPNLVPLKFAAIYCSPLQRCRQTLKLACPRSVYNRVLVDDRLLEQPYGTHISNQRSERNEVIANSPIYWDCSRVAETNPISVRTKTEEYQIILDFTKMLIHEYPDKMVLIVCHGRWISRFLKLFCKIERHINNAECLQVIVGPEHLHQVKIRKRSCDSSEEKNAEKKSKH